MEQLVRVPRQLLAGLPLRKKIGSRSWPGRQNAVRVSLPLRAPRRFLFDARLAFVIRWHGRVAVERTNATSAVCPDDDRAHRRCDFLLRHLPPGNGSQLRRSHQCASMAVLAGSAVAGLHVAHRRMAGEIAKWTLRLHCLADRERIVSRVLVAEPLGPSMAVRNMAMDGPAAVIEQSGSCRQVVTAAFSCRLSRSHVGQANG